MGRAAEIMQAVLEGRAGPPESRRSADHASTYIKASTDQKVGAGGTAPVTSNRLRRATGPVDDGLRYCHQCVHVLASGVCSVASPKADALVQAMRGYVCPAESQPFRCRGFRPFATCNR
jgi:hypothetical protein